MITLFSYSFRYSLISARYSGSSRGGDRKLSTGLADSRPQSTKYPPDSPSLLQMTEFFDNLLLLLFPLLSDMRTFFWQF